MKDLLYERRSDFRGGRNVSVTPDLLDDNELVDCTNARLDTEFGGIAKRTGSRRLHANTIGGGATVFGLTQWEQGTSTNQIVAIANGNLYHKTSDFGEFTEVVPGNSFSTTLPSYFTPHRANTTGAALRLYIASGTRLYRWTGTTLTEITGTNSAPTASHLAAYHTRLFTVDSDFVQNLFWSVVGDPEDFTTGALSTDAGNATVSVIRGEEIEQIITVGSSLLIATEDSIARFSGFSSDDIQIAQDTEGIATDLGVVGGRAIVRVEQVAPFMSDRGPHIAMEAGVQAIGVKVEADFEGMDRANIRNVCVGHHKGRREVWYAFEGASDTGNRTVLVYNYRMQTWYGPFTYNFAITYLMSYEDSAGVEYIMAGCADGRVRHLDTGAADDVLADGTGGSAYQMLVELKPFFLRSEPGLLKSARRAHIQIDHASGTDVDLEISFDDDASFTVYDVPFEATGDQSQRIDINGQGNRMRVQFTDDSTTIPIIIALSISAYNTEREA